MVGRYNINNIVLGEPSHAGHVTYLDATYSLPDSSDQPIRIIVKKNKYGKRNILVWKQPLASWLVCF